MSDKCSTNDKVWRYIETYESKKVYPDINSANISLFNSVAIELYIRGNIQIQISPFGC